MKKIEVGTICRVIGGHDYSSDPTWFIPVIGKGPNVGKIVTVTQYLDYSMSLGHVWRVSGVDLVSFLGEHTDWADFSEEILEPIDEANPTTNSTEIKEIVHV